MELIVEQVSPVVRPLLATYMGRAGAPTVEEGGAAGRLVVPATPRSRSFPWVPLAPDNLGNCRVDIAGVGANAAWRWGCRREWCPLSKVGNSDGAMKHAVAPGWAMDCTYHSWTSKYARTWLLLKNKRCPDRPASKDCPACQCNTRWYHVVVVAAGCSQFDRGRLRRGIVIGENDSRIGGDGSLRAGCCRNRNGVR